MLTGKDSSSTSDRGYRIIIKGDPARDDAMKAAAKTFFGPSPFMCSKCGATVTVSKKKAVKLRKRKRVTIMCKKCKKAIKARRRGK